MNERVRAGVVGCGAISERLHVPDYATSPHAEVVALCDLDVDKAKAIAKQWAPDARVYTDYTQMLKESQLDCVSVTTPNHLHAKVSIDCLEAGCHVLVEKPMATSSDEAQQMIDAASKAGKLLLVNQSQRLHPAHKKAKEVIDSGILGNILHVTAMFGHSGPENWSPTGTWFFDVDKARFGAMADLGVHKADLVRYLTGMEVAAISAYTGRLEKEGATVEDNFVSCLQFAGGAVGTLCASWTVKGFMANYTIIHGSRGTLRVCELPDEPLIAHLAVPKCDITFDVPKPVLKYEGSWGIDAGGAFAKACLGLEPPYCTGEEGKKSLEIILAAERAAQSGRSVSLGHSG